MKRICRKRPTQSRAARRRLASWRLDPQRLDRARQGPHRRGRRAACRVAARSKADTHRVTRELPSVSAGNEPIPLGNSYYVNPFSSIARLRLTSAIGSPWRWNALMSGIANLATPIEVRAASSGIVLRTLKLPALARQLDRNVPRGADDDRASVRAGPGNSRFKYPIKPPPPHTPSPPFLPSPHDYL